MTRHRHSCWWGLLAGGLALTTLPAAELAREHHETDWATLHGNPARTGFAPRLPAPPWRLAWRKELHRELLGPRCEVIVAAGRAYLGTYAGVLYCWDAATGEERWTVKTGGPIGCSPTCHAGTLYFGSMDGKLYALAADSGKPRWTYEAGEGIWTSPAVTDDLVLFGDRAGVFHAVRTTDGTKVWTFETAAPILTSAALSEDKLVVFASEDMHAYCLELPTGKERWKSRKMAGLSVRDHFPVLAHGLAFLTTNPVRDFHKNTLDAHDAFLVRRTGFAGKDRRYIPGTAKDVEEEQNAIVELLRSDPSQQTFYAFRLADGKEPWVAPILYTAGLHNPYTPPCVDPESGTVHVITRSAYSVWDGGGEVRSFTAVGTLDPKTGRVRLLEHSYKSSEPGRPPGRKDMPWDCFNLIGDETQTLSCAPGVLLSNHQGTLGCFDLKTGRCEKLWGKRDTYGGFYGPGEFGWEKDGGLDRAAKAGKPYGLVNEWHGPAKSIAAVASGRVYLSTGSQVICLEGAKK